MVTDIDIPVPVRGVMPHLDRQDVPPDGLIDAENFAIIDGIYQVRSGLEAFATAVSGRPMAYFQYRHSDGNYRVVKASTTKLYYLNNSLEWTDITDSADPLTGGPTQQPIFRVFQKAGATWLLMLNPAHTLKKWDGLTSAYTIVGGSPVKAQSMMVLFDRVLLGNLSSGSTINPAAVDVCANKDFDSGWNSEQTEILSSPPGDIISMNEFGGNIGAIYKTDGIVNAIAQGATDPFAFEPKVFNISGPCSALSVVWLSDGMHAILCRDGAIRIYDGTSFRFLEDLFNQKRGKYQKQVASKINWLTLARSFGFYDQDRRLLFFVYSETGEVNPGIGVMIDMSNGAMWPLKWDTLRFSAGIKLSAGTGLTIGSLVGTIGAKVLTIGEFSTTPQLLLLLGEENGQSYKETGTTDNAAAIIAYEESGLNSLGNKKRFKTLQSIEHYFAKAAAAQEITVKIGVSNYGEERVLDAGQTLAIGSSGPYTTGHRKDGRFFSRRYEASATQAIKSRGQVAEITMRSSR